MPESGNHPADDEKGVVLTKGNALYSILQCVLCGKCLSVGPVSESDGQFTCGRCRPDSASSQLYAAFAEHLTFTCIFSGCKEKLRWGKVKAHEKICDYRHISCPFSECADTFQLIYLWSHLENVHTLDKLQYHSDELNLENFSPSTAHLNLRCISYKGLTFLVFIKIFKTACCENIEGKYTEIKGNCYLGVFSIGSEPIPPNLKFEFRVNISSDVAGIKTIKCDDITKYIETKHCLSCCSKICRKSRHENIGGTFLRGAFAFSNYSNLFSYVVKFYEKTCIKASLPNFECPICKNEFEEPIYLCQTGHSLCSACRSRLDVCPFCKSHIQSEARNFTLEQIIREHEYVTDSE